MTYLCPHSNSFPIESYVWCVSGEKAIQIGGARFVEKNMLGSNQTGSSGCKQAKVLTRPRFSERRQYLRAFEKI